MTHDTYTIDCPDCDWQSHSFDDVSGEIAAKVDAELRDGALAVEVEGTEL